MSTPAEELIKMMERVLELVKSDEKLHDALLGLINAMTLTELAKADYHRSRIK